jgi:hypothetical protein
MNRAKEAKTFVPLFAPVAPSLLHEKQFFMLLESPKRQHQKQRASSEKQSKSLKGDVKQTNGILFF